MDTRQEHEAKHFDLLAEQQGDTWWGNRTYAGAQRMKRRARLLKNALAPYECCRVIELGCGTGTFTEYILAEIPGLRLECIDISPKCVEIAQEKLRQYPNVVCRVGDARALDYQDASVDVILGASILHHLPMEGIAREAFRVLNEGGLFWFSEPNMMNPEILLEKNVRIIGKMTQTTHGETAFFRWRLKRFLSQVGFRDEWIALHRVERRYFLTARAIRFQRCIIFQCRVQKRLQIMDAFQLPTFGQQKRLQELFDGLLEKETCGFRVLVAQ